MRVRIKPYFAIAFALMIMMSSTVSAATITVDDSGGQDHTTIQAAVNAANDSDTIIVYPGTYVENVDVNKSVNISSQSGNPDDTHVQAANSNDHVFNVTRNNVTISGFTATGATGFLKAGIFLDGVQNNVISDNNLSNNTIGIILISSSNNKLSNNTANSNFLEGIVLRVSNNNTMNNNTASNNFIGIVLDESSNNNTLNNNTANSNNNSGIVLERSSNNTLNNNNENSNKGSGISLEACDNNTLNNNTANSNLENGIFLSQSSNNTLNNNNASNNDRGIVLDSSSNDNTLNNNNASNNIVGIRLADSSNNTLNNNTANSNNDEGIVLIFSSNNTLSNNTASNNDDGIELFDSSNNKLSNNTASNNNDLGILLNRFSNNNTLNSNVICNNSAFGIRLLSNSDNNNIYNNYFNNTNNTQIDASSTGNVWNITKTQGPNIIGGPFLGGNYWAHPNGTGHSQTCTDANNDGFCDSQFDIDASNTDYLPLTINGFIDIEKFTNGFDADVAPGPAILVGHMVTWTYNVTNNGNVILNNITVIDDKLGEITCPNTTLQPGESMVCTVTGTAQLGQYSNFVNVTAVYEGVLPCNGGNTVKDSDSSHYIGFRSGGAGGLPYEPPEGVPAVNPFLLVGALGIALVLFLRRELK